MSKKNICVLISILLTMTLLFSGCDKGEGNGGEPPAKPEVTEGPDVPGHAPEKEEALEYEYEYVKAVLKDNALTVTILPGDAADRSLGQDNGLRYGEPYPVSGLADSYTDLFVGSMGNSVSPFVFLLTGRGTVECVPVGSVLLERANSRPDTDPVFTAIGELPGVSNVTSFHDGIVSDAGGGYATVFAVTADGNDIDLSFPCYYAMNPQEAPPTEEEAMAILAENAWDIGFDDMLEQGMSLMGTGNTEYICDEYCSLIAAGTDHEGRFVRERYFGVGASGAIYEYEAVTDRWNPSNRLARIYSDSKGDLNLFSIICEPNGNELEEIRFNGRLEEVVVSDPLLYSDTPMVLLPLKNNVNIKVELIDFSPEGEILSETVIADLTLSRGDLCAVYAKMMYDTSPLFILATWQDGPSEFTAGWWAVGGAGYGETYIEYIAGFGAEEENAMG